MWWSRDFLVTIEEKEEEKAMAEGTTAQYTAENIQTLEWWEHIRLRPGMYIGKLGDGTQPDDGIYVLLKEVFDNSLDEHMMGAGSQIDVTVDVERGEVSVRDYGRGIPLESVVDVASKMNTGAKYDSAAFTKSVGLNGVGIKAVNALSERYVIVSYRDGQCCRAEFHNGQLVATQREEAKGEKNGVYTRFLPDSTLFKGFKYQLPIVEAMLRNYTYLNTRLTVTLNGEAYHSDGGLIDLLEENMPRPGLYPPIHLIGDDIEVAFTHGASLGEDHYTFVNGQHTTQGGTHLTAFREVVVRTIKDFFKKDFQPEDIRMSMVAALSIRVQEPVFESQTKTKLGSKDMGPEGPTVRQFITDFVRQNLDNYLHQHPDVAEIMLEKIQDSERDRKAMASVRKSTRETAKKVSLNNPKLRDCRIHYNTNHTRAAESTIFITEGDSASGSITKSRDPNVQAVFSLKGKPLNSYLERRERVYENEELNLLKAALSIEEGIDNMRYNRIVIATDADVDGMHIRMLLTSYFLLFYPEVISQGHLYIFQTPLFRVRNKKDTRYCYSEEERLAALKALGSSAELTRFKGLGEISPDEFAGFLGGDIRLDRIKLTREDEVDELLRFFMGKNTPERQNFIIDNLRIEEDIEEDLHGKAKSDVADGDGKEAGQAHGVESKGTRVA